MAATVFHTAEGVSIKRYAIDTDHAAITGRGNVLAIVIYVAFPGSEFSSTVFQGIFFTTDAVESHTLGGGAAHHTTNAFMKNIAPPETENFSSQLESV